MRGLPTDRYLTVGRQPRWLDQLLVLYRDRVLPVDLPTARRWGRLCGAIGHESADLLIAATALEHGLTVVTRNVRHFRPTGVQVLEPFGPSPEELPQR